MLNSQILEMFKIDLLSNTELYKISVMGGLALNPDKRELMQAYINEVVRIAGEHDDFASYDGARRALWNFDDTCKSFREEAAKNIGFEPDFTHWETFDFLTRALVDLGKAIFLGHMDAFISSLNDSLLLHAAMAMPDATKLREHYMGSPELDCEALIDKFKSEVAEYVNKFNNEYVDIDDYFKRANELLELRKKAQ